MDTKALAEQYRPGIDQVEGCRLKEEGACLRRHTVMIPLRMAYLIRSVLL